MKFPKIVIALIILVSFGIGYMGGYFTRETETRKQMKKFANDLSLCGNFYDNCYYDYLNLLKNKCLLYFEDKGCNDIKDYIDVNIKKLNAIFSCENTK